MSGIKKGTKNSARLQLELWRIGKPSHDNELDQCCPDFSCCNPDLLADKETREKFFVAEMFGNEKTKSYMLGMFLGCLLAKEGKEKDVHLSGFSSPEEEN